MDTSLMTWRGWTQTHVRPRDLLALVGVPCAVTIGILATATTGLDSTVRATGITASLGAITTLVGYYFGRGEASGLAREVANLRGLLARAQQGALQNAAELEDVVRAVTAQTGVEPRNGGDEGGHP